MTSGRAGFSGWERLLTRTTGPSTKYGLIRFAVCRVGSPTPPSGYAQRSGAGAVDRSKPMTETWTPAVPEASDTHLNDRWANRHRQPPARIGRQRYSTASPWQIELVETRAQRPFADP